MRKLSKIDKLEQSIISNFDIINDSIRNTVGKLLDEIVRLKGELDKLSKDYQTARSECIKLTQENNFLKARLNEYENKEGDTKFIRYMGETYCVTDIVIEDSVLGNELKKCSVEGRLVEVYD